jgi:hypothetical protein
MKLPLICLASLGIASALPAQAACYTVYLGSSITYRSTTPPVDLSRPYSETLPARFGGGASMITTNDEIGCTRVVLSGGAPPEGISHGASAARGDRGRSATKPRGSNAPASLDAVFVDPSLQMRSSVGVSEAASAAKVQHPVSSSLLPPPPSPPAPPQ